MAPLISSFTDSNWLNMYQYPRTDKSKILREMPLAIAEGDWEATYELLNLAKTIHDVNDKVDVLNQLLVMKGHELHQEVTWELQEIGSPSSIPYIRQVLTGGFDMFDYTSSESGVIAKWFSHALASINTPESLAVIKEFTTSSNSGVAQEMVYRLCRLDDEYSI